MLFNIVIQPALDMLEQRMHQSFAYQLACNPQITLLTSAYADDIQLVSKLPEENECLLDTFDRFLHWSDYGSTT